jgi:hypothetical protein
VAPPGIRRVVVVQTCDKRDDLPYQLPVHWAAHGGNGTLPLHQVVHMKQGSNKGLVNLAIATALTCIPGVAGQETAT